LAALGWLGWRLLEQDRALENQRDRDHLESAAGLLAHELERALTAWEELLPGAGEGDSAGLPPDAVLLVFDASGILKQQGIRLQFYPRVPAPLDAPAGLFAAAEIEEFREEGLARAATSYRNLASSSDRHIRAAALMRLARSLRKQQELQEALAVYGELAAMGETPVAGSPAELMARRERIALFRMIGDKQAADGEAASLGSALSEGRYRIDRATFDFYRESALVPRPRESKLADAVESLWPLWQQQAGGQASWTSEGASFVAVWRRTSASTAVVVGDVNTLVAPLVSVIRNLQVHLALEDPSGHPAWGTAGGSALVTRTFRETGLPWTLRVAASNSATASEVSASRRRLMSAGFGLMLLVIAAAGYFVFRAVSRELSVARLQSDFVAAVSHEFRTPLTAMRHLTEMLEEGDTPQSRLPLYYRVLGKETRRLHAMVESLLDFGRMEAGRRTYRMEDANAAELAQQVVDEFREHSSIATHRLELQSSSSPLHIRADRDALALALRNLLDNAVKYSPEDSTVSVSVESHDSLAGISVQDQGVGIPKEEQREVFRKFSRGSSARKLNVKGTGIGLTMADQIVKAHGGRLELASEPGCGSRFTILLPVQAEQT
jgi:signal transduction histidine kinase